MPKPAIVASESNALGSANAVKFQWNPDRQDFLTEPWPHPSSVIADDFESAGATKRWLWVSASGGGGTINANSTANSLLSISGSLGSQCLQVTPAANSRLFAMAQGNLTPKKKLAFEGYFAYDTYNVRYVSLWASWEDDTAQHNAFYRFDTFNKTWQYLPSTALNTVGPFTNLNNGAVTIASGAWTYFYFTHDAGNDKYGEFTAGKIGVLDQSATASQNIAGTREQQLRLYLGAETNASGAGNAFFDNISVFPID